MIIWENIRIALKAIYANKMRSILTTLGIIIGVGAVVGVVSIVQGLSHTISVQFEGVGATYLMVFPNQDHFARFHSSPSTFNAAGFPVRRGIHVQKLFALLQYSSTSKGWNRQCIVARKVWKGVSRYLCRMLGSTTNRTPL